jgi:mannitol/fructose-specific phosphotransferase system IIA component (Ntr-type)
MSSDPGTRMNVNPGLNDFTRPQLIVPRLRNQDFEAVIQELSQLMEKEKIVPDLARFYQAVLKRELLIGTDMEAGMAFPHARLPMLKTLSFALGRSNEPLRWGPKATRPVRLVFLMAVPEDDSSQYLSLISGLVRLAKDPELLAKIHAAQDAGQLLELLGQIKLRTSSSSDSSKQAATR